MSTFFLFLKFHNISSFAHKLIKPAAFSPDVNEMLWLERDITKLSTGDTVFKVQLRGGISVDTLRRQGDWKKSKMVAINRK